MNSVCEAVKAGISKSFPGQPIEDWKFVANDPASCTVVTPEFTINLFIDARDRSVSSSILYHNLPEDEHVELYSHVICKLFPGLRLHTQEEASDEQKMEIEIQNVRHLLNAIVDAGLSGGDLMYFYLRYNSAYTDYMNSD